MSEGIDFATLFEQEPTPCAVLTPDLVIRHANSAYLKVTRRRREIFGRHLFEVFPDNPDVPDAGLTVGGRSVSVPSGRRSLAALLQDAIVTGEPNSVPALRYDMRDAKGVFRPRFWRPVNVPLKGPDGSISLLLHRVEDITDAIRGQAVPESRVPSVGYVDLNARVRELQAHNAELRTERDSLAARALRDPLTGALSRSVFYEELARALSRLRRSPHPLAVLFVDLDRLKQVNDCHGHAAGDELIRQSADRIAASVRPSDAVARIGGDEFVVLLDDLQTPSEAEVVADRILATLSQPCQVAPGVLIDPSASVGVALGDIMTPGADALLSHADAAMYKAKQSGRGRYALFDSAAYTAASARAALEAELRKAVPAGQLTLHYQPIYDLTTGRPNAVEALLRWNHPLRGTVAADSFIDVAEDSGLMGSIGPWVIDEACRQLARWDALLGDRAPEQMYLNVSVGELIRPGLQEGVRVAAASAGIAPARLVFEVTESGMLDKPGSVSRAVDELISLGCQLAIDDFGTGYSALSRLVELPANILKIDQSFVRGLGQGHEPAAIIAAVLLLAHNLRKTVVAEGVEDAGALATLTELGCGHAQGYFLGRPQPPDEVTEALRNPCPVAG